MTRALLAALLLAILAGAALAQPATRPSFIGVYGQASTVIEDGRRVDNFARWKARGVHTLVLDELSERRPDWIAAAKRAGLKYVLKPVFRPGGNYNLCLGDVDADQLRADDADPDCVGFALPDEYDRGAGTVADAQRVAAQIRAVTRKSIHLNFTGQSPGLGNPANKARVAGLMAACDVIGWDFYLYATGRTPFADTAGNVEGGYGVLWVTLLERAHEWGGGKPQWVYLDCSTQGVDARDPPGPTPFQLEEMVRFLTARSAARGINFAGVVYFPQRFKGGFKFDATPADVAAAMPALHARYFPQPDPTLARLAALEAAVARAQADAARAAADVAGLRAGLRAAAAATQPSP